MYKRGFKGKRKTVVWTIIIVVLILLALVLSLNFNRKITNIEDMCKMTTSYINKVIMYPFTALTKEKKVVPDESYIIQKNMNESLKKEIDELKQLLELNKTLSDYDISNATVLSRNKSYWFNTLTIDKGRKDGIQEDMAVITSNGLVGKISKVYSNSSEIKLITSDDINYKVSVSIKINDNDNYAILNGYDYDKNLLMVTGVSKTINVEKGQVVLTSGLGGVFPSGIYVGEVEEVKNDKYDLSKTLYIKTKQDFNNIHYVGVLKGKSK